MNLFKTTALIFSFFLVAISSAHAGSKWKDLLDDDLSQFETWLGVPHSSTKGLPAGTYQSDDVRKGTPFGLNRDPLNIFTVSTVDGEKVLKITGEIFGAISTKKSYENYHLKLQVKWGYKRWAPRQNQKRDSGLLYHCYGDHGAFWQTWKACMEYQIQENDIGDFIGLAGPQAIFRGYEVERSKKTDKRDPGAVYYDPTSDHIFRGDNYTNALLENDQPLGNWNEVDLYVLGDEAVHVINGEVVFFAQKITDENRKPLTKGQIQLQSEAAEVFYKNVKIKTIKAFPEEIEQHIKRLDVKK